MTCKGSQIVTVLSKKLQEIHHEIPDCSERPKRSKKAHMQYMVKQVEISVLLSKPHGTLMIKKAVCQYFKVQIKNGLVPEKTDCEACQAKHPSLRNRKWTDNVLRKEADLKN